MQATFYLDSAFMQVVEVQLPTDTRCRSVDVSRRHDKLVTRRGGAAAGMWVRRVFKAHGASDSVKLLKHLDVAKHMEAVTHTTCRSTSPPTRLIRRCGLD